ncbi:ABC transporter ATP-binding protein [Bacillus cihuensis]|uniref:ABC transporter ATP-binding protein n=1 Tax=Bacillus cihuensis TaxID=1208599 RepID=UPI00042A1B70|nr:ABC transporter ATP-binding protein [Bacillus cihuensis]
MPLLEVRNLHTEITTPRGMVKAINGVDFQLESGEILALVGESGSGKSMTAMSIMGLLPKKIARITEGSIRLNEREITKLTEKDYNLIRGQEMAMIFQNPLTALDPTYKIGQQLSKTIAYRKNIKPKEAKREASYWLEKVGISDVDRVMNAYPHALSGGMRQRVVIAMAISCQPKILIADEPTTALDATIQKQILTLLKKINQELNISIIIITHDFGVVANLSDKVAVMYAGKIIEYGETRSIFSAPRHPYTQGLIKAVPEIGMKKLHHRLVQIDGSPPDLLTLPNSCSFAPRCREATSRCFTQVPNQVAFGNEHFAVCFNREVERRDHTG